VQRTLGKYYRKGQGTNGQGGKLANRQGKLNINNPEDFLPALIAEARQLGSSDIHIECYEEKCRVRIRIDGMLIERHTLNKSEYPSLINKVKIQASLDISEKRLPQDGR